jgi:hypothetical protein
MVSSRSQGDPNGIEIQREKHWLRHWRWSGIFPYGGWIPDPHFISTRAYEFDRETAAKLPAPARYQGFDVNPWFEDESSEVVIAIEAAGTVYEYRLKVRERATPGYGFVNGGPIESFHDGDSLIFLTTLHIVQPAMIVIPLPLRPDGTNAVHYRNTPEWQRLMAKLTPGCAEGAFGTEACKYLEIYDRWTLLPLSR